MSPAAGTNEGRTAVRERATPETVGNTLAWKGPFIVSLLSVSLFVFQVRGTIDLPVVFLIVPMLLYPIVRIGGRQDVCPRFDVLYVLALFLGTGGILAYEGAYPLGYSDVYNHLDAAQAMLTQRTLPENGGISLSFYGLYVVTTLLVTVADLSVHDVARGLPLIAFLVLVLTFYRGIARQFLEYRPALFATLAFGLSWGVFRFHIEYRTLVVAYPLFLLVVSLLIKESQSSHDVSVVTLLVVLISGLAISHFTTYAFYLVFVAIVTGVSVVWSRGKAPVAYLLLSVIIFYVYLEFVSGTLGWFSYFFGELAQSLQPAGPTDGGGGGGGGGGGEGVLGVTYGYAMFAIQWIVRGGFVAAFAVVFLQWLRSRDRSRTLIVLSCMVFGPILLAVAFMPLILNPGRVLTFFAVPYALAYAFGIFTVERMFRSSEPISGRLRRASSNLISGRQIRNAVRVVAIVLLVLMMVGTIMKFPVSMIGEPEPVRQESRVDSISYLSIDAREFGARSFIHRYHDAHDRISARYGSESRSMNDFYRSGSDAAVRPTSASGSAIRFAAIESDRLTAANREKNVYDNGKITVAVQSIESA